MRKCAFPVDVALIASSADVGTKSSLEFMRTCLNARDAFMRCSCGDLLADVTKNGVITGTRQKKVNTPCLLRAR